MLVPIGWTLWGVILLALLYGLVRAATERDTSPEVGAGVGVMLFAVLLALHAGVGFLFAWAVRRQSSVGIILLAILLGYPLAIAIARPLVMGHRERKWAKEDAKVGDFPDATLAALATAIRDDSVAELRRLLDGKAPPTGNDRAGNDLLAYAAEVVRTKGRGVESMRALLEAGADARGSRTGEGVDLLNHLGTAPGSVRRDAMRLLLEHGADPNAVHPASRGTPLGDVGGDPELVRLLVDRGADVDRPQGSGVPAVVHYIGANHWESALYLIERGARLDVANADGLSVDYYLKSWKESVYGAHPDGWERVKAAIAARRARMDGPPGL